MSSRSLRSRLKRWLVWRHSGGLCALCHEPLSADWEADHRIPWRFLRRTNLFEMDAVHQSCNRAKGGRLVIRMDAYRPGQHTAHVKIVERVTGKMPYTAIVLPPRYGKSDVMRASAAELFMERSIGCALVLVPFVDLAKQLLLPEKVRPGWERLGLPNTLMLRHVTDAPPRIQDLQANGEYFLTATIGLVRQNLPIFLDFVEAAAHSGRPVLIFIDEAQYVSDQQAWGDLVRRLVDAGARACLLTGTPWREDGTAPPGFNVEVLDPTEALKSLYVGPGSTPETVLRDRYWLMQGKSRLIPDVQVTLAEAWKEDPSPLCKFARVLLNPFRNGEPSEHLSTLSRSAVRELLPALVRDPRVIDDAVRQTGRDLLRCKHAWPELNPGWIVYCGNDREDDEDSNAHARAIKKEIKRQYPSLRVAIATMRSESKASDLLSEFRSGQFDVLIVKQMGGVGLDVERVVGITDLSSIRSMGAATQRWFRAGTPWTSRDGRQEKRVAILILLDELLSDDIFQTVFVQSGGASPTVTITSEFLERIEVPRTDKPPTEEFIVGGVDVTTDDLHGRRAGAEDLEIARLFLEQIPRAEGLASFAELAEAIRRATAPPAAPPEPVGPQSLNVLIAEEQRECVRLAKQIARQRYKPPYSSETYRALVRTIWREGYDRAGLGSLIRTMKGSKLPRLTSLEHLKRLWTAFKEMLSEGS